MAPMVSSVCKIRRSSVPCGTFPIRCRWSTSITVDHRQVQGQTAFNCGRAWVILCSISAIGVHPVPVLAALVPTLLLTLTLQGAPPVIAKPGAPGQPTTTLSAPPEKSIAKYTPADAKFMQGMLHHHAQAIEMV